MSLQLRQAAQTRDRAIRFLATSATTPCGRSGPYRRIHGHLSGRERHLINRSHLSQQLFPSTITNSLRLDFPGCDPLPDIQIRSFSYRRALYQEQRQSEDVRDFPREKQSAKEEDDQSAKSQESDGSSEGNTQDSGKDKESKKEPPPPPPHGDKSPWQVFTETLRSEFKASKEWNDSTKALASSAHQFTENESVKRARAAYTSASGVAGSATSSALKSTGKALGQGAAWTWDTPVVKGVRAGMNLTGKGIDIATKPVRETKAYKKVVGDVKEVIDDGSSSRYGGWTEKEERRKQRELRELNESKGTGRSGKRVEKMEEDPK